MVKHIGHRTQQLLGLQLPRFLPLDRGDTETTLSANSGRDQCNSTSRVVDAARQTNPDDYLLFRRR